MSYCTWRDYRHIPEQYMARASVKMIITALGNIPVGGLFIALDEATIGEYPPVICMRMEADEHSSFGSLVPIKFGLESDHPIYTSADKPVIPLCGSYNG